MIGKILDGKYRIERLLGAGAMGSVYAAVDVRTDLEVAIKVIHAGLTSGSVDLVQRFEREARAAGSIDTEHIARCLDIGADPDTQSPYMVLEHLHGEDLHQLLKRTGPIAPDLALRIAAQACRGLRKAHEANVIHRDIKPANLYLDTGAGGARTVKLLDFGVAKIRRDPGDATGDTAGLTRTGSIVGSPLYMSPEQARSMKDIDHRADLWSLGIVIYQSLAGRTPFAHISGLGDLIIAMCSALPPPVQQFAPWVPPEIAALLDGLLRVVPGERFQTAAEVLDALEALLPAGTRIDDSMLVPLDAEAKVQIAPTYFRGLGGSTSKILTLPGIAATSTTGDTIAVEGATRASHQPRRSAPEATAIAELAHAGASTQSAVSTTGRAPAPGNAAARASSPSMLAVAVGAVICLAVGGLGAYVLTRPGAAGGAPSSATTSVVPPEPPASSTASISAAARSAVPATEASATPSASAPPATATTLPLLSPATRAPTRPRTTAVPTPTAPERIDHTVFGDRK